MLSAARIFEVLIYSLLNFVPFLLLAVYPFRHDFRLTPKITGILILGITIIQILLGILAAFFVNGNAGVLSAFSTLLYVLFYFFTIKKRLGKLLFMLLMVSNQANFVVLCSKCLEGQFFPELSLQSYRWSFSLMMLLVELCISVPLFFYLRKISPALEKEPSGFEWRYLWLVPGTFYLIWYYQIYGSTTKTSLQFALTPRNSVFSFFMNIGAGLIYYVVAKLISEQDKNLMLQENNHQLSLQTIQYQKLQDKITDARRIRHDVRHHIAILQEYMKQQDYEALKDYLDQYQQSIPDDPLTSFCSNPVVNTVLLYFAQLAKQKQISYSVHVAIPENCGIQNNDLTVLFGNLLENAYHACVHAGGKHQKINVLASMDKHSLCISVENSYSGPVMRTDGGLFLSTRHTGVGLGTQSIRHIAEKYGGFCRFDTRDSTFYASVMCFVPETETRTNFPMK